MTRGHHAAPDCEGTSLRDLRCSPWDPCTVRASRWWLGSVPKRPVPSALCHSQWVLAFEIFIPLVLFFILLGLRQKKPTIPVKEGESQQGSACGLLEDIALSRGYSQGLARQMWWVEVAESVPAWGCCPGGGSTNHPVTVTGTDILRGKGRAGSYSHSPLSSRGSTGVALETAPPVGEKVTYRKPCAWPQGTQRPGRMVN